MTSLSTISPCFDGVDGRFFGEEDSGRAEVRYDAVFVDQRWVDGRALDHGAFGGEISHRETHGWGKAAETSAIRSMMTSSGSMPSCSCRFLLSSWRRGLCSHQSRQVSSVSPETVFTLVFSKTCPPQMEHHLGQSSGEEDLDGGKVLRTIGQRVYQARHLAIDVRPVFGALVFLDPAA